MYDYVFTQITYSEYNETISFTITQLKVSNRLFIVVINHYKNNKHYVITEIA